MLNPTLFGTMYMALACEEWATMYEKLVKAKPSPEWVAGTRALDGGCCELDLE
jgi:hypothetical protein